MRFRWLLNVHSLFKVNSTYQCKYFKRNDLTLNSVFLHPCFDCAQSAIFASIRLSKHTNRFRLSPSIAGINFSPTVFLMPYLCVSSSPQCPITNRHVRFAHLFIIPKFVLPGVAGTGCVFHGQWSGWNYFRHFGFRCMKSLCDIMPIEYKLDK